MENDDPVMEVYARLAYEAHARFWKGQEGPDGGFQSWDEIHELEKASWVAVAKAVQDG